MMTQPIPKPEQSADGSAMLAEIERRHRAQAFSEVKAAIDVLWREAVSLANRLGVDARSLALAAASASSYPPELERLRAERETTLMRALLDRLSREEGKA